MIRELLYKHSLVGLNNGVVLEGFVQTGDEKYFKMVELDNSIVIVRIDDISFARLVSGDKKSYVNPLISSSQPAVKSDSGYVTDEVYSPPDSNISKPSYPPPPLTRLYGPIKNFKPAPPATVVSKEILETLQQLVGSLAVQQDHSATEETATQLAAELDKADHIDPQLLQQSVMPPVIELDEEGFAIGLPRGVTTMDYPFAKPSLGKVVR